MNIMFVLCANGVLASMVLVIKHVSLLLPVNPASRFSMGVQHR